MPNQRVAEKEREFPFTAENFQQLSTFVFERTGIVLAAHKRDMVYTRLSRRLRALGLPSFAAYCDLIDGPAGREEISNLINAITTNLTRFFREPHHFDDLRERVLAKVQSAGGGRAPIRVWSAGCSSGEEPYSVAMTLADTVPNYQNANVKVLATDLDTNMLAIGRAGAYPKDSLAATAPALKNKFTQKLRGDEPKVRVTDAVRRLITFNHLNLLWDWPMKRPFDAIFCRNVMIYFDTETKARLIERFVDRLQPGGVLYLGHSESLINPAPRLRLVGRTTYEKVQ